MQAEPTVVPQLNAFVSSLNEVMEALHFTEEQKTDLHPLYTWKQYQPIYQEYMENKVTEFFDNIYRVYTQEESEIVSYFLKKKECRMFQTESVGYMSNHLFEYADQIRESQDGERLFELL